MQGKFYLVNFPPIWVGTKSMLDENAFGEEPLYLILEA